MDFVCLERIRVTWRFSPDITPAELSAHYWLIWADYFYYYSVEVRDIQSVPRTHSDIMFIYDARSFEKKVVGVGGGFLFYFFRKALFVLADKFSRQKKNTFIFHKIDPVVRHLSPDSPWPTLFWKQRGMWRRIPAKKERVMWILAFCEVWSLWKSVGL